MNGTSKTVVSIIGIAVLLAVIVLSAGEPKPATAQLAGSDLRQLLNDLWNRTLSDLSSETLSNFTFTVTFKTSVSGLGNSVTFGQNLNSLELREAGADYFCTARKFSRNTNVDCIPFENVATISFTER